MWGASPPAHLDGGGPAEPGGSILTISVSDILSPFPTQSFFSSACSWGFSLNPRAEEFPHPSPRREPLHPWGWDEACVSTRYLQTALGSESTQEGTGLMGVPRVTEQKRGGPLGGLALRAGSCRPSRRCSGGLWALANVYHTNCFGLGIRHSPATGPWHMTAPGARLHSFKGFTF